MTLLTIERVAALRRSTLFAAVPDHVLAGVARVLLDAGADPDAGAPSARAAAQMFARQEILDLLG